MDEPKKENLSEADENTASEMKENAAPEIGEPSSPEKGAKAKKRRKKKDIPPEKRIKKLRRKVIVQGIVIFLLVLACLALAAYAFRDFFTFRYAEYLIDNGELSEGIEVLNKIPTYDGVPELLEKYKYSNIGSSLTFGTYEQDGNTFNGNEPLEWIIIDYDQSENKTLIVTRYCIDCKQYKDAYGAVTWETSDARAWLNDRFISKAFSAEEKSMIVDCEVTTPANCKFDTDGGNITVDKVFLLSDEEFNKYLADTDYTIGYTTKYASDRGVQSGPISGTSVCWLRTPGESLVYVSTISYVGELNSMGVYSYSASCGIRPAMWISAGN